MARAGSTMHPSREAEQVYRNKQVKAHRSVSIAIANGNLKRPDTCELCGRKPEPKKLRRFGVPTERTRSRICAHHWNGYENPLDIWWVCHVCSNLMIGPKFHNGTLSKEEAKVIIADNS